jgi:pimeloyl-ACP methyl ester carboxylesterase
LLRSLHCCNLEPVDPLEFIMPPEEPKRITLSDKRSLSFAIYGSEALERPVFFLHGFPGSRLEASFAREDALELGLSLIAIDRPGWGLSDPCPQRSVLSFADDLGQLAKALGIERCGLLAVSGGAPYAAACAFRLPQLISRLALVSGMAPVQDGRLLNHMVRPNRMLLRLAQQRPHLARMAVKALAKTWIHRPQTAMDWFRALLPADDRRFLKQEHVRRTLLESMTEGLRQGPAVAQQELLLLAQPWGFDLKEIRVEVGIWHGLADSYVPSAMARALAESIPGARACFVDKGGHFMILGIKKEVLAYLRDGASPGAGRQVANVFP